MALAKPSEKDVTKLHAEVNQIANQRFLLTTISLPLFGAIITLMVSRTDADWRETQFALSTLLSVVLLAIYAWSHILKNTMRVYTTYLVQTQESGWERDWKAFRDKYKYTAHSKPQAIIFVVLIGIGILLPWGLAMTESPSSQVEWGIGAHVSLLAGLVAVAGVSLWGFFGVWNDEDELTKRWMELSADGATGDRSALRLTWSQSFYSSEQT